MTHPEIPFNTGELAAQAIRQTHEYLNETQVPDQLEEGKRCDRKVAEGAKGGSSSHGKKS